MLHPSGGFWPTPTSESLPVPPPPRFLLNAFRYHSRYEAFDKLMEAEDGHWIHEVRIFAPQPSQDGR